jgi:hypothetical protein
MNQAVRLSVLVALSILAGCSFCETQPHAERAREIPQERLAVLFAQLQSLNAKSGPLGSPRLEGDAIPPELMDLAPRSVVLDGVMPRLNLGGCVDDFVLLIAHDGEGASYPDRIVLVPGEARPQEVLWERQ